MALKHTILVVEDERPLREALTFKLEDEGYHVLTANDGAAGLRLSLDKRPDCILLDIIMPVMDGFTTLEKLRENAWGKTAKVIVLTNLANWSSMQKTTDKEIRDYLVKSDWKIADVIKKVAEVLTSSR